MAELFKFRCYQCQKLIGAPPSKFGKVVKCPRCESDLIVPSPEGETAEPEDPDAFRPEDFGINLEPERLVTSPARPLASTTMPENVGPDPIAFLSQVNDAQEATAGENPDVEPPSIENLGPDVLPEARPEPLVVRGRGRGRSISAETLPRSRDVILPRTAVVAWSLFAILGLAFAFGFGLLIGHFLWK